MDAVALAFASAALFGAMPVAVRFALVPPLVPAAVGALLMQIATFAELGLACASFLSEASASSARSSRSFDLATPTLASRSFGVACRAASKRASASE